MTGSYRRSPTLATEFSMADARTGSMNSSSPEPSAWREGDLVVVRRDGELPPICMLSGREATHTVRCYFHWQERSLAGGSVLGLIRHYVQDVRKVVLDLPLADDLRRLRRVGWGLFGLTAVLAVVTIGGIILAQMSISQMPPGAEKRWWNDLGVPIVALTGFLITGLSALGSYKVMPMPTKRLKPVRIDALQIWLAGASPAYLARLPHAGDR